MPGLFFCFFAREIFRDVRTKTFSAHVRGKITALVRKTGLSTHVRGTRPDMGPQNRSALLLVDVYPVEGLEPGEPASPYAWGVAVGIAQVLLDAVADLALRISAHAGIDDATSEFAFDKAALGEMDAVIGLPDTHAAAVGISAFGVDCHEFLTPADVLDIRMIGLEDVALVERNTLVFKMSGPVFVLGGSH